MRLAYLIAIALLLGGCVRMREAAYYAPPAPPEPCEVDVSGSIVKNAEQRACVSREHAQKILREMQGER